MICLASFNGLKYYWGNQMKKLLSIRGIHWVTSRFGWKTLQSLSFDAKYESGDWNFTNETPTLVHLVEKYSLKGHILVLGCGAAPIASALNQNSYETFLGVDLSEEAINIARQQTTDKIHFEIGDMVNYQCARSYDVILFSDCLYYVPLFFRKGLLKRMSRNLTSTGRIIVVLAQPAKYETIIRMIRRNFAVEVDGVLEGSERHVLVLR